MENDERSNIALSKMKVKLYENLIKLRTDLKKYISEKLKGKSVKVSFTLKDEHVWDDNLPRWRYWIGLDEEDINIKDKKIKSFIGYNKDDLKKEKEFDITPNIFFPRYDVSGDIQPGKNWFIIDLPKDLSEVNEFHPILGNHKNINEVLYDDIIQTFFGKIFKDDQLVECICHKTNKEERNKKKEKLIEFAFDSMNNKIKEEEIKAFWGNDDDFENNKKLAYFRFLIRAIDYYSVFKNNNFVIGYGLTIAGYHLLTFYIYFNQSCSSFKSPWNKHNYKDNIWISMPEMLKKWNIYQNPIINEKTEFYYFLSEIDNLIKMGWTNTVNTILKELAIQESMLSNNITKVLEHAISCMLLMENPVDSNKLNCQNDEVKFFVKNDPKKTYSSKCAQKKVGSDCIYIKDFGEIVHNDIKDLVVAFRNWEGKDKISSELVLRNMIVSFIEYYYNIILPKRNEMIKSAIAAVISRNMSHNIGSHTLSKLNSKQLIEKIEPQFKGTKDIHDEYRKKYLDYFKVNGKEPVNEKDEEFSTEGKIASFNSYLQNRMDFVADLVTSTPSLENSILFDDVLEKFKKNVLLNNTISGVDDLIVNLKYIDGCEKKLISFPNDQLGCQAFYIILENIIRNCAKHGSYKDTEPREIDGETKELKKCDITITIKDYDDDKQYYEIMIYDNDDDGRENIELSKIVKQRNEAINKPILDETGSLRHGDWGTLEMKIAAAYLRKIESYKIDDKQYNANEIKPEYLIEAIKVIEKEKTQGFGYKFLLMKPKEILIVDFRNNNVLSYSKEQLNQFKNQGIWIKNGNDLFPNGKDYCGEVFNHDFLIVIPKDIKDIAILRDEAIKNFLPMRVLIVADEGCNIKRKFYGKCSIKELTNKLEEEKKKTAEKPLLEYAWECWSEHLCEFYEKGVVVNDNIYINRNTNENGNVINAVFENHRWNDNLDNYQFYESCSSISKNEEKQDEARRDGNIIDRYELSECIISNVAILDERIQSNAYTLGYKPINYCTKIPYFQVFEKMRIHIPDINKDFNLSKQSFDERFKDNVVQWINKLDKTEKLDFLIIHLGLIEKLLDDPSNKNSSEIKKYIERLRRNNKDLQIIIVSGRGEPHNLPDNELFMNYSMIPVYLFEYRSKYHFNKLLYSGRRKYGKQ